MKIVLKKNVKKVKEVLTDVGDVFENNRAVDVAKMLDVLRETLNDAYMIDLVAEVEPSESDEFKAELVEFGQLSSCKMSMAFDQNGIIIGIAITKDDLKNKLDKKLQEKLLKTLIAEDETYYFIDVEKEFTETPVEVEIKEEEEEDIKKENK